MTYSRAGSTTIGPGCLTAVFGMGTGVAIRVWSPGSRSPLAGGMYKGSGRSRPAILSSAPVLWRESGMDAVKRSAVSTGPLRRSPALHARPIDLVFFQEPMSLEGTGDLIWRRVSRLYAFSVYPGRTLATQRCR